MRQYLDALEYILENGKDREDRTGVGTKGVFGYQMRFDLRNEFPAVTTKKLAWRAVVGELLWMLEGSSDERRLAEITFEKPREELVGKTTIWTANADNQARNLGYTNTDTIKLLGPIYGNAWSKSVSLTSNTVIEIEKKVFYESSRNVFIEDSDVNPNDEFVGKVIINCAGTEYKVLRKVNTLKNSSYEIQCIKTGHKEIVTRPNLRSNTFGQKILFDRFYSTAKKNKNISYYTKAYNIWYNMINRCYNTSNPNYALYGGKGVIVDERWFDFKNFLYDLESLPFFYEWLSGTSEDKNPWCLDKDYYNTNKYSKETCIFLPEQLNKSYSNTQIDFTKKSVVELPNGNKFEFLFVNDVINRFPDMEFNEESVRLCLKNQQTTHKNCKFYTVEASNNCVFRKQLVTDQIARVLENMYHDPYSRRHIVSAWNSDKVNVMALPPCHTLFQFYIQDGELSCQLYQRSVDAPLGLPFNIASYSLLTHMFAQILGLKVGEFIHTSGDLHIYQNQIEGIKEQLKRSPLPGPTLEMPEFLNLDDLIKTKPSQYTLINYQHYPEIKMPFAV